MISITGKLNKTAKKHPSQNGVVFLVNIGKQEYNRTTKEKEWVNYSAALFAKDRQAEFYDKALNQGAIIQVSGAGVLPRLWGDNNDKISLDIQDAKLGFVEYAPSNQVSVQAQAPQQQNAYEQMNQADAGMFDNDSDLPF